MCGPRGRTARQVPEANASADGLGVLRAKGVVHTNQTGLGVEQRQGLP